MKRNVPVSTIMTSKPATIPIHGKPSDVLAAFEKGGFHHMPVVHGDKLVGLITSTDLLKITYDFGADPRQSAAVLDHTRTIEDIMVTDVKTVHASDPIRDAFAILAEGTFHALPVVDNDALVGIVTSTDLLRYALEQY
jgi:CBS domain-containing protein